MKILRNILYSFIFLSLGIYVLVRFDRPKDFYPIFCENLDININEIHVFDREDFIPYLEIGSYQEFENIGKGFSLLAEGKDIYLICWHDSKRDVYISKTEYDFNFDKEVLLLREKKIEGQERDDSPFSGSDPSFSSKFKYCKNSTDYYIYRQNLNPDPIVKDIFLQIKKDIANNKWKRVRDFKR